VMEWLREVLVEAPAREAGLPRVVQLVGDPGVGKAAVVIQASTHFRRHFPDGQYYVNAEGWDPATLVGHLSGVFGAAQGVERLRAVLHTHRALLVLDNVADARLVRPLLTAGGACAIIVIATRTLTLFDGMWTVSTVDSWSRFSSVGPMFRKAIAVAMVAVPAGSTATLTTSPTSRGV